MNKVYQCIQITNEIKRSWLISLRLKFNLIQLPEFNTFYSLWQLHGLGSTYRDRERIWVMQQWIDILYPEQQYDLRKMHKEMTQKQFNMNSEYYKNGTAPRFNFSDSIDTLIGKLELPKYQ